MNFYVEEHMQEESVRWGDGILCGLEGDRPKRGEAHTGGNPTPEIQGHQIFPINS